MSPADPVASLALVPPRSPVFPGEKVAAAQVADPVLASLVLPGSPGSESFRVLSAKVKALGEQRPLRCIGLVSATPREGTSTMALGLAAALAQEQERRVLLVEAALRAPALEQALGLAGEPGLSDWLGSAGRPVPLRRIEPWGLFLLTAGTPAPQSAELLGSEKMAYLLEVARQSFDWVLIDCPPLETLADAIVLQDLLDGLLLVVRARHASRDTIRGCVSHLKASALLGIVFNDRTEILARWLDRRRPRAGR